MEDLQFFDLDGSGEAYVRRHLTGVNAFSSALLAVVQETNGRVSTIAPVGTPNERLYDFESGGLLAANRDMSRAVALREGGSLMEVQSLHRERGERVLEVLRASAGRIAIIDDYNPTWGDGHYKPEPSAFGVGAEVYHLVTGRETPDEVADILGWGDTIWHGISAVCAPTFEISRQTLSSAEALRACAQAVVEITCTAYDREGFVIWSRHM